MASGARQVRRTNDREIIYRRTCNLREDMQISSETEICPSMASGA